VIAEIDAIATNRDELARNDPSTPALTTTRIW
jgi:hypothetical protein